MKQTTLAALILLVLSVLPALAAPGTTPVVTITSPAPGVTLATDAVEVTVVYTAPAEAQIARLELVVDGKVAETQALDQPETAGAVTLSWEASAFLDGNHRLLVRAVDTRGRISKSAITVSLQRDLGPTRLHLSITDPLPGAAVAGVTEVRVEAAGPQVKYVVFLVDNVFKAMSNLRPFAYSWDTTRYLNGLHRLQAKGYLDDGAEALSRSVRVKVDNPGGLTIARLPSLPKPEAAPVRRAEPVLPPAVHAESPTPYTKSVAVAQAEVGPPGSAPYVSATGDLVTPPTSAVAARVEAAAPRQMAALPGAAVAETRPPQAASPALVSPPPLAPAAEPRPVPAEAAPARQIALLPPAPVERGPEPKLIASPAPSAASYTVQQGDTLWSIAARYGVTPVQLGEANHLDESAAVRVGQQMRLPSPLIQVNGRPLAADVPPMTARGRTLAPLRAMVEQVGGNVRWEPKSKQATALAKGHQIAVRIGSEQARVDRKLIPLGAAATLQASRTMVPVRFLGEALDMVLQYEDGVLHLAAK